MGDRTYVYLYVPAELFQQAKEIAIKHDREPTEECTDDVSAHWMGFAEVNYGELNCTKELRSAGIAYDMDWGTGSSYEEGNEYCRFSETGELIVKTVFGSSHCLYPSQIEEVIEKHNTLDAVKELLKNHYDSTTPLPWDNQVEYGKLYRTKQLLCPNKE